MKYTKRIRDLREDNDLDQEEIAKLLHITKQGYSLYETGKRKLPIEYLIILADYYKVSADYILGRTDNPEMNTNQTTVKNQINGNNFGKITMK